MGDGVSGWGGGLMTIVSCCLLVKVLIGEGLKVNVFVFRKFAQFVMVC